MAKGNVFIQQAKKQSQGMENIVANTNKLTALKSRNLKNYGSATYSFSAQVARDKKQLKKFIRMVNKYTSDVDISTEVSDYDIFRDYYLRVKPPKINIISSTINKGNKYNSRIYPKTIKNPKYTEAEAAKLYVYYWTNRMIAEHNIRADKAKKLYKTSDDISYSPAYADIQEISLTGDLKTINIDKFELLFTNESTLYMRSQKSFYRAPKSKKEINKATELILSGKRLTEKEAKSKRTLFASNLFRALKANQWGDAVTLIEQALRDKTLTISDIYYAYNKADVEIVFEYSERVSNNNDAEQRLIDALKDKIKRRLERTQDAQQVQDTLKQYTQKTIQPSLTDSIDINEQFYNSDLII